MIELIYAIIIGIIQGLTEFLPISSTAHMTIVAKLLGSEAISNPKTWTAMMATIQLGTLGSLLFFFRKDLLIISKNLLLEKNARRVANFDFMSPGSRLGWMILLGSLPIFLLGYFLKELIEGEFTKSLLTISIALISIAIVLFISEKTGKFKKIIDDLSLADAIIIGFAQSLALIPGVSRSGATIAAGLFIGLRRDEAAKFSFLLSIPAVLVSGVFEFVTNVNLITSNMIIFILVASVCAFVSGIAAISFLLHYLKTKSTVVFVVYRILLGLAIIFWLL